METRMSALLMLLAIVALSSGEIHNVVRSKDFDSITGSKEIVAISFIRFKPYDTSFQNNFREAGDYLKDFGVHLGTVDCLSDPVSEYCLKAEAAQNVYVFRNGKFLLTLAYDTLFGVDSIISNILHLVLLVEVPIISEQTDIQQKQAENWGKKDIIFGYVPAVGLKADRSFMEIAFAYRHKFTFLMTTNRELLEAQLEKRDVSSGSSDSSQPPRPKVFIFQCRDAVQGQPCPWALYHGPISTGSLALMMKTMGLPAMVDLTKSGHSTNPFMENGVPAVYAVAGQPSYKQALAVVMENVIEFRGDLGFVIVDREDVALIDLDLVPPSSSKCDPACFVLRGHDKDVVSDDINSASQLRDYILANMNIIFGYLGNPALEDGEEEEDDGQHMMASRFGDGDDRGSPKQEQQDDLVQEATVHLRQAMHVKESPIPSLTDTSFPQFTHQPRLTGILFTMKWNPRSLAFLESFESAAQSLTALLPNDMEKPPLAQVECSSWPDVCDKSNVTVYPTVKMYREKMDVATYGGILDEEHFLRSYLLYNLPSPVEISSADDMDMFTKGSYPDPWIKDHMTSVTLAIIPDSFTKERAVFRRAARELQGRYLLGLCSSGCQSEIDHPSIVVYKLSDPHNSEQKYKKGFTVTNLLAFIQDASLPVLPELTAANMPTYLARAKPFVILFHAGDSISDEAVNSLRGIASDSTLSSQFVLCQMDSSHKDTLGSQTLVTYGFLPTPDHSTVVILDRGAGEVCRYPEGRDSSPMSVRNWLEAFVRGTKKCSESRALIDRDWKPLVPPYDYLKFMEDADEHLKGKGRRGLKTHQEENVPSSSEGGEGDKMKEGREPLREKDQGNNKEMASDAGGKKQKQQHKRSQHIEL